MTIAEDLKFSRQAFADAYEIIRPELNQPLGEFEPANGVKYLAG